jgi:hypothetical protein
LIKKLLAFGIIFLFFGANVVTSSGHIIENNCLYERSQKSFDSSKEILSRGKTAYAYIAYSGSSGEPEGPCYFDLDDPGDFVSLAPTQSAYFLTGGTWSYEYGWFGVEYNSGGLWKIDPETGDMEQIGGGGTSMGDLAWDDCTSTLYGTAGVSFYEIDPGDGGQIFIGGSGGIDIMGIAFDSNCICYGVGYNGSAYNLYTIDFSNLEITFVAPLTNCNCNFICNAEFDKDNDVLYLLSGFTLYTCDTETGECTSLGNVEGGAEHEPIYIHGNNVFIFQNGVTGGSGSSNDPYIIDNWKISAATQHGIIIKDTSVFFEIRDCYIHEGGSSKDGIVFYNVTNGAIINNILTGNRNGTVFATQGPDYKENSCLNKIYQNEIFDNTYDGIHFQHTAWEHHSENEIFLNNITGNNRGIYLIMSEGNFVYNNNIISNSEIGVELFYCMGGGCDNKVFHNNFINNGGENGQGLCTDTCNDWDNGYPSGGNYWNDYTGEDNDDDGIGDDPYFIYNEYGEDDYDMYPLMEPYVTGTRPPYTTISFEPPFPNGGNGWYVSDVNVTLEADDDTGINATYYRINEEIWEIYESPFVISEEGDDILIEYYSVDIDGNVERVKTATLDIDKTPPNMTVEWEVEKVGWRKLQVTFTINISDETNGIDRLEIFLNDALQCTIPGSGPTYSWSCIISGNIPFSFKFIAYDIAGNYAVVVVNDTDISSHNFNKDIFARQSNYFGLLRFFEKFLLLQKLLYLINL